MRSDIIIAVVIVIAAFFVFRWYRRNSCPKGDRCVDGKCCEAQRDCRYPRYHACAEPDVTCATGDKCVDGKCCIGKNDCQHPIATACGSTDEWLGRPPLQMSHYLYDKHDMRLYPLDTPHPGYFAF